MKDKEGAERACVDPYPIIDGRKANVNLAYLGAKPKPHSQPSEYTKLCLLFKSSTSKMYAYFMCNKQLQLFALFLLFSESIGNIPFDQK